MPCGDQTGFPSDAFATVGKAILAKQISFALLNPACDVICFVGGKIGGGDVPIPFPKPTFGAGLEELPDAHEVDAVGNMLAALGDQPAEGVKMAPNVAGVPWALVFKVVSAVLQGLLLAAQPAPVNPAQP